MAHTKSGGSTQNVRDSQPKYLGVKISDGQSAKAGAIVVRQRGNTFYPGENVRQGKDHTLFATKAGKVKFSKSRKTNFSGQIKKITVVSVVS